MTKFIPPRYKKHVLEHKIKAYLYKTIILSISFRIVSEMNLSMPFRCSEYPSRLPSYAIDTYPFRLSHLSKQRHFCVRPTVITHYEGRHTCYPVPESSRATRLESTPGDSPRAEPDDSRLDIAPGGPPTHPYEPRCPHPSRPTSTALSSDLCLPVVVHLCAPLPPPPR